MNDLIKMIIEKFSFLYYEQRFKFVDSETSKSFDNALVILESPTLRFKFIIDRGAFILFIATIKERNEWFDGSLIKWMLTSERKGNDLISDEMATFYKNNFSEVENALSELNLPSTKMRIEELKTRRAKLLFG